MDGEGDGNKRKTRGGGGEGTRQSTRVRKVCGKPETARWREGQLPVCFAHSLLEALLSEVLVHRLLVRCQQRWRESTWRHDSRRAQEMAGQASRPGGRCQEAGARAFLCFHIFLNW